MSDIKKIEKYFKARVNELILLSSNGEVWEFLGMCSMIEYLAKLVAGEDEGRTGYKRFIETWLVKVRPLYRDFQYDLSGEKLCDQMYHVLRCGIIHSFSLIPDSRALARHGRKNSIVLCHRPEATQKRFQHLQKYRQNQVTDAALFVSEDFAEDIRKVVEQIFFDAYQNQSLQDNILKWCHDFPPIAGGF